MSALFLWSPEIQHVEAVSGEVEVDWLPTELKLEVKAIYLQSVIARTAVGMKNRWNHGTFRRLVGGEKS